MSTIRAMAIRFLCAACNQPIEVDDEWASRLVACPYCRRTVAAPAQSTLEMSALVPEASPAAMPGAPRPAGAPRAYRASALYHPNRLAVVALALAGGAVAMLLLCFSIVYANQDELSKFMQPGMDFSAGMKSVQDYMAAHGGMPPGWLWGLGTSELAGGLLWLGAVVCGVIGSFRVHRRGLAIGALVLCGLLLLFVCGGWLLSLFAG